MDYKGYHVVVKPSSQGDGFWLGGYEILRNGQMVRNRTNVFPGFLYFEAACTDSIEHAKIEIDNLRAVPGSVIG